MQLNLSLNYSIWLFVISIILLWIFSGKLSTIVNYIDDEFNLGSSFGGTIILSVVTNLPEISGGLAFVKKKTYQPIVSDIFGGNAFLPVLFLVATLITRKPILPNAQKIDIYLTTIAIIIRAIYLVGMVLKLPTRKKGLGIDSWILLVVYILSIFGMFYVL